MKKTKGFLFSLLCIAIIFSLTIPISPSAEASPGTIYVPNDYPTIQAAVNAASPSDTIIVREGTYTENVNVNKDHLTIQSENGAETTIVQSANPDDHVFAVTADYVNISGFNVTGAGSGMAGIYLDYVNRCNISNNTASNNWCGIYLASSSNDMLRDNTTNSNDYAGIHLGSSSNNTLTNNIAENNEDRGISLGSSSNNTLTNNTASNNYFGIYLDYASNNTLMNNITSNNGVGISLGSSSYNTLASNTANSNFYHGIHLLDSSNYNTLTNNTALNNYLGIYPWNSSNNTIYLNNLIDNADNTYSESSTNIWNSPEEITYTYNGNTYTSYLGNYWSDYCIYLPPVDHNIDEGDRPDYANPWENEPLAYDDNTDTFAESKVSHNTPTAWLELFPPTEKSQGIRFWIDIGSPRSFFQVEVLYSDYESWDCLKNWNFPYSPAPKGKWVILDYPEGEKSVEKARVKFHSAGYSHFYPVYLNEFQFKTSPVDADNDGIADAPCRINGENDNYPLMEPFENYETGPAPVITQVWTSDNIRGPEVTEFPAGTETVHVNHEYENPVGSVQKIIWHDEEESFVRTATHVTEHESGVGTWSLTNTVFLSGGHYLADLSINDILLATVSWTVEPAAPLISRTWTSESVRGLEVDVFPAGTEKVYVNYDYVNPLGSVQKIICYDSVGTVIEIHTHVSELRLGTGTWGLTYPGEEFWPAGSYWAELFINDVSPEAVSWTVEGLNQPPHAEFTYSVVNPASPGDISSGDIVSFDASNSSDPEGAELTYEWNFGDGETATGCHVDHRFRGAMNQSKTYTVTLTVEDNSGATATDSCDITVTPLEKIVEVTHIPGTLLEAEPYARMTVSYNWVDTTNGDDVYMISRIRVSSGGFIGAYSFFILDAHSRTDPLVTWWDVLPSKVGEVYASPFPSHIHSSLSGLFPNWEPQSPELRFYGEDFFEGFVVRGCDIMNIRATGWPAGIHVGTDWRVVVLKMLATTFFEEDSAYFDPERADEPHVPIDINDFNWAHLCSPGEFRVYDSQGRVTGLVDGEVVEEIPDSVYFDNTVVIFSPLDSYHYEVLGTEDGSYGLLLASFKEEELTTFAAIDIPTSCGAVHRYVVDWSALSEDENGVTVQIDSDGDGVFERTITEDNELTGDEFILQTATTIDFDPDTLNLKSKGKVVSVYIELPPGYDVSQIDVSSIMLSEVIPALTKPTQVGDYDSDGVLDLMVKFDRAAVENILIAGEQVAIRITGEVAGIGFEGSDSIRVVGD